MMLRRIALVACLALAAPAGAVQPDEVLDDPVLEERARAISEGLRCMVCRNESIDESNADLARDMRLLVRERLVAGDSDEEVLAFIVDRYGEYALLRPTAEGGNIALWVAGPFMALVGLIIAGTYIRRRSAASGAPETLSEDEKRRLSELLNE